MQTLTTWAEVGNVMLAYAIILFVGEIAVLAGAAFGANTSMVARERAGRPLVAWEPVVCGIGGAVLAGFAVVVATVYLLDLSGSLIDGFSWYVFFAAAQGAFIGLWVALYRTVGMKPSRPASRHEAASSR